MELIEAYIMCSMYYSNIKIGDEVVVIENLGTDNNHNKEPGYRCIVNEIIPCDPFLCTHCLTNKIIIMGRVIGCRGIVCLCNVRLSDTCGREYKSTLAPPYKITNKSGKY